jgi:hypothetical protein
MEKWIVSAYVFYSRTYIDPPFNRLINFVSYNIFIILFVTFLITNFIFVFRIELAKLGLIFIFLTYILLRFKLSSLIKRGQLRYLRRNYSISKKTIGELKITMFLPTSVLLFAFFLAIILKFF